MTNKIKPSEIDIDDLDNIAADEFFEAKERFTRLTRSPEAAKDNFGHKKSNKRIKNTLKNA